MNVLILTGSARPNSAGKNIAQYIEKYISKNDEVNPEIVDVSDLKLPFYDADMPPSADYFEIPHDAVRDWSNKVKSADAVIWVSPEYNGSISAIQKNAIDWLFKEWSKKPVAIVAYGWHAGARVLEALKPIAATIDADVRAELGLRFEEHIQLDGTITNEFEIVDEFDKLLKKLRP